MTRFTALDIINGHTTPSRVVVLHRQGDQWQVLAAQPGPGLSSMASSSAAAAGRARLVGTWTIAADDQARLLSTLESAGGPDALIVQILPGGSMICRQIVVPDVDEEASGSAASLQAEAELPAAIPSHRRSAIVLPWPSGMNARSGLAIGWPGEAPTVAGLPADRTLYMSGASALVELLIASGQPGLIAYLDRTDHTVELVAQMNAALVIRNTRLTAEDWSAQVNRTVLETAMQIEMSDDRQMDHLAAAAQQSARASQTALVMSDAVRQALGDSVGQQWTADQWSKFGVAAAAAIGMFGPRRDLIALIDEPPQAPRSRIVSALNWAAEPLRTRWLMVAGILAVILVPFLSVWLEAAILGAKTSNIEAVKKAWDAEQSEAAFFRALKSQRLPVTKLLADIGSMAPYDIQIDVLNLSRDDVTISGIVPLSAGTDLKEFQNNLYNSRMFDDVKQTKWEQTEKGIQYEFSTKVSNPTMDLTAARKYTEPYRVELYGPGARDMEPGQYINNVFDIGGGFGAISGERSNSSSRTRSSARSGSNNGDNNAFRLGDEAGDSGGFNFGESHPTSGSLNIPPPLTDQQIAAMDRQAASAALVARGRIKNDPSLDPATKARINEEWTKITARFREILNSDGKNTAGAAGGAVKSGAAGGSSSTSSTKKGAAGAGK